MKIGICDDEHIWLKNAENILKAYFNDKAMSVEICCFQNETEALSLASSLDIIFMDIELKNKNGIAIVSKINEINANCFVVYLTNYLYYVTDVYDTTHDYYVLKDQFESKLDKIYTLYEKKKKRSQDKLTIVTIDKHTVAISINQIMYLEHFHRITRIITVDHYYDVKMKIENFHQELKSHQFIRCHKSFLINPVYVKENRKKLFFMENGDEIPISQRYTKSSREEFLKWTTESFI